MKSHLFKACFLTLFIALTSNVYAEYYLVYGPLERAIPRCYFSCAKPCIVSINSKAPYRRHGVNDQYEMQDYGWIGDP